MKKIDMSESAVLRRLKQVDQLRDLGLSLMKARPISNEPVADRHDHSPNDKQSATVEQIEHSELTGHFKLPNIEQH